MMRGPMPIAVAALAAFFMSACAKPGSPVYNLGQSRTYDQSAAPTDLERLIAENPEAAIKRGATPEMVAAAQAKVKAFEAPGEAAGLPAPDLAAEDSPDPFAEATLTAEAATVRLAGLNAPVVALMWHRIYRLNENQEAPAIYDAMLVIRSKVEEIYANRVKAPPVADGRFDPWLNTRQALSADGGGLLSQVQLSSVKHIGRQFLRLGGVASAGVSIGGVRDLIAFVREKAERVRIARAAMQDIDRQVAEVLARRATLAQAKAWQLDELSRVMADVKHVADRQGTITIEFDNEE